MKDETFQAIQELKTRRNRVFALYVSFCEGSWELMGLYWKEKDALETMEKYQRANKVSKYIIEEVEIQ